ncbi:MAG: GGDEF domain-containing protein [Candidatus Eisenbacteria bacterium]
MLALSASVVLQLAAATVAWGALRRAGPYRFAWICMSSALIVMVQRRLMPIAIAFLDDRRGYSGAHPSLNAVDAVLALTISALMLAGIHGLRSLFLTLDEQAERLRQLSEYDPLTGLRNRRSMTRDALREVQRSYRTGGRLSALMLDLDHFKQLNDTYGHAAGDTALARLAGVLRCQLREVDLIARWGGEEFLVVLPDTDAEGAERVAERLRRTLAEATLTLGEHALHITSSIGATTLQGSHDSNEAALAYLIAAADQALYRAKHAGRNRVAVFECGLESASGGLTLHPVADSSALLAPECRHLLGS